MKQITKLLAAILFFTGSLFANNLFAKTDTLSTKAFRMEYTVKCLTITAFAAGDSTKGGCKKIVWNIAGTSHSGLQITHTFPKPGTYQVCVKLYDTCHKTYELICHSVKVDTCINSNPCNLNPVILFTADCKKLKFRVDGAVTGATYSWDFGDGSTASTNDPVHIYAKEGTYKVCMTMKWKTSTGTVCSKTVCKEIKVSCGNDCHLKGNFKFSIGNDGKVKFYASSDHGVYYKWDFGDGTHGYGQDPSHQYKPGTYKVCVTIYDKSKRCSTTVCKTVHIENKCRVVGQMAWKKLSCNTFQFFALAYKGSKIEWSFGDGTYGSGYEPKHTYSHSGTYKVCVKIWSHNKKCYTIICKEIHVKCEDKCAWYKAGINGGHPGWAYSLKCRDIILEGNNLNNGCVKYQWQINGVAYNGRIVKLAFANNGTYKICLKLIDTCKKCDTIICKEIKVNCAEPCKWWTQNTESYVAYQNGKVYASSAMKEPGCIKVYWAFNGGSYTAGSYQSWSVTTSGTYKVCMKLVDTCNNCDTLICKEIKVTVPSKCNWASKAPDLYYKVDCKKVTFEAKNLNDGCIKYAYNFNSGSLTYGRIQYKTYTANGTYTVCLKLIDTCHQCDTIICKTFKIDCDPCHGVAAEFSVDSIGYTGKMYVKNTSTGAKYYYWDFGDNTSSYDKTPGHTYKTNGTFTACLYVWDSLKNCKDTFCKTITIKVARSNTSAISSVKTGTTNVYPNPASNLIYISTTTDASYAVMNAQGKMVGNGTLKAGSTSIETARWTDGLYFIRITSNDNSETHAVNIIR